jgi:hypothetical protein
MSALGQKSTRAPQNGMSALPPKADMCSATRYVRFTPNSDRESGHAANGHVRFTPKSEHVRCSYRCPLWANSGHQNDRKRQESNAAARGKVTLISVNSPGCVSTSIDPPCCFTIMS